MTKFAVIFLGLCSAIGLVAQPVAATTQPAPTKHYRLTFVLSYAQAQQPSKSFVLDVPVAPNRPGISALSTHSGLAGQSGGSLQENLEVTDVRESEAGIAAQVNFTMTGISTGPAPNTQEPLITNLTFSKKIDVVLGKPSLITEPMRKIPLKEGDEAAAKALPDAPQITVTVTEI